MPRAEHRGQHRQGAIVGLVHQLRFQRVVPPLEGVLARGAEDDVLQRVVMPIDPDRVLGLKRHGADAAPVVEDLVADGVKGHAHGAATRAHGGLAQIHRRLDPAPGALAVGRMQLAPVGRAVIALIGPVGRPFALQGHGGDFRNHDGLGCGLCGHARRQDQAGQQQGDRQARESHECLLMVFTPLYTVPSALPRVCPTNMRRRGFAANAAAPPGLRRCPAWCWRHWDPRSGACC